MESVPVDGWHRALVDVAAIEVALARGHWRAAVEASDTAWDARPDAPAWAARIAGLGADHHSSGHPSRDDASSCRGHRGVR
jgi:hypothetical protein